MPISGNNGIIQMNGSARSPDIGPIASTWNVLRTMKSSSQEPRRVKVDFGLEMREFPDF